MTNKIKTEILKADNASLDIAADLLKSGEVVAVPTETVYGLAGNGLSADSVKKIFEAKGRPSDNPLILHIENVDALYEYSNNVPELALKLAEEFWPGSLTMILDKMPNVPYETSGGLDTVAFRMPNNKWTLELIRKCGFPLSAPSANLSGLPSPTCVEHVCRDMNGRIPLIIDGGNCSCGLESTVITFTDGGVRILRPGAVTPEMLEKYCSVQIDKAVTDGLDSDREALSPGMKYKHYSPKAQVYMVDCSSDDDFISFVNANSDDNTFVLFEGNVKINAHILPYGKTADEEAAELFASLRKADDMGAKKIYVRSPEKKGMGLAVYNRLIRAAAFKVIKL